MAFAIFAALTDTVNLMGSLQDILTPNYMFHNMCCFLELHGALLNANKRK